MGQVPARVAQGKPLKKHMAKVCFPLRCVREITNMIRVLSDQRAMNTSTNTKNFDTAIEIRQEPILMLDLLRRFDGVYSIRLDVQYILLNAILGRLDKPSQRKNTHGDGHSLTSFTTGSKTMSSPPIRISSQMPI